MQIIAELEPAPRGVYTGAIGWLDAAGELDLSIAIRTAVACDGGLAAPRSAAASSRTPTPERELRETRDKGRAFARSWAFEERSEASE